jgi:hypothetical protein
MIERCGLRLAGFKHPRSVIFLMYCEEVLWERYWGKSFENSMDNLDAEGGDKSGEPSWEEICL